MASFAGSYDHTAFRRDHAVECYGKTVTVYLKGSSTKATLYTDRTKVSTTANPITAGATSWIVYLDPGSYDVSPASGFRFGVAVPADTAEYGQLSERGGNVLFGSGAPNAAAGTNGDLYVRSDGGSLTTIYQKRSGTWTGIV